MRKAPREHFLTLTQDMPEFFPDEAPETVAEVFAAPLELPFQPFEIRGKYAPTPLDGLRTRNLYGSLYDDAALLFMDQTIEHHRLAWSEYMMSKNEALAWFDANKHHLPNPTWLSVLHESRIQHELKLRRNDRALAPMLYNMNPVSHEKAEELMQIRGGIASLPTMLRFLAQYPSVGGIEIMKATIPFCPVSAKLARSALMYGLGSLDEPDMYTTLAPERPKRLQIQLGKDLQDKPDSRIMVFKTVLAKVAIVGAGGKTTWQEIVCRDSGVVLDPRHKDDMSKSYYVLGEDDSAQRAAPISITAYARPAKFISN